MPIPIAKEQEQFKLPKASSSGQGPSQILPIQTGLPEAVGNVVKAGFTAHNVMAQIKVDNDTAKAIQLTLALERKQNDLMNSTELDDEGNVVGFLNKKGNQAFNSIRQLDDNLTAAYNNYLAEMAKLSPVAIEKQLLKGNEIINSASDKAFQHAYSEHNNYLKTTARASNGDIIKKAKGDDYKISKDNQTDLDTMRQNNEIIARIEGWSPEVLQLQNQTDTENYFKIATTDCMRKYSNSPIIGGGAIMARKLLDDAFDNELISIESREELGHNIDLEAAKSASQQVNASNFDDCKKVILTRKDLTKSEKELYLNNLDTNLEKEKKKNGNDIADSLNMFHFNLIPKMAASGSVTKFVSNLVSDEVTPYFDEESKEIKFIYRDRATNTLVKTDFDGYAEHLEAFDLLNNKIPNIDSSRKYIYDIANRIYGMREKGAGDEEFKKLKPIFDDAIKTNLSSDETSVYNDNELIINNTNVSKSGEGSKQTNSGNGKSFSNATALWSKNYGVDSINKSEALNAIGDMVEKMYFDTGYDVNEKNKYKRIKKRLKRTQYGFGLDEGSMPFGLSDGSFMNKITGKRELNGDAFINELCEIGMKYADAAQYQDGFAITIPTESGSIAAIYKGDINMGKVLKNYIKEVGRTDWFMNAIGDDWNNKMYSLSDSQKKDLEKIFEQEFVKQVGFDALNGGQHLITQVNGEAIGSQAFDVLKNIVSKQADTGMVINTYNEIGGVYNASLSAAAKGDWTDYTPVATVRGAYAGLKSFFQPDVAQTNHYTQDLKTFTVSANEFNDKNRSEQSKSSIRYYYTPIVDYNTPFAKELPDLLNSINDFFSENVNQPFTTDVSYEDFALMGEAKDILQTNAPYSPLNQLANQKVITKQDLRDSILLYKDKLKDEYQKRFGETISQEDYARFQDEINYEDASKVIKNMFSNEPSIVSTNPEEIGTTISSNQKYKDPFYYTLYILNYIGDMVNNNDNIAYFDFNKYNKYANLSKKERSYALK